MKNNIKNIIAVVVLTLTVTLASNINAQTPVDGKQVVEIKTSAVCGMCKKTIETALYKVDGVKSANLDVESKIVYVKYDTETTSIEQVKKAINLVGYDADDIPADEKAYENLHGCCKKDAVH